MLEGRKEVPQMRKKLVVVCAAIAAFAAFVIAPVASASPILTSEGEAVAVGTSIKGNHTGVFDFTAPSYTIICTEANMSATVTANSGTKIKMEIPAGGITTAGTGPGADCTSNWAPAHTTWSKICIETGTTDNVIATGCGANITMTTNLTELAVCKYLIASMPGTFVTNADATIRFLEFALTKTEGSGFFCPSEIKFTLDFDLTTTSGATLAIS